MHQQDRQSQDIIGVDEALDLLGVSKSTLYRWLREGGVRGFKTGRQWRFHRAELLASSRHAAGPDEATILRDLEAALAFFRGRRGKRREQGGDRP